jgi:hypothetical protein
LAFFFPISSMTGPWVETVDCVDGVASEDEDEDEEEEEELDGAGVSGISGGSVRIHCINGEKLCVFK